MTSRLRRRSRHRLHKQRNKVRSWRRRHGYDDRKATQPTLFEMMELALQRIPAGGDAMVRPWVVRNPILDDLAWTPAPDGPYKYAVKTPLPPVPPGLLDSLDYDWPEDNA